MNALQLQATFTERLQNIRKHLKSYVHTAEDKDLHRLRVQLKKLRALLRLPQFIGIMDKDYQEVKRLFRKAGKIREPQIMLDKMEKYGLSAQAPHFIRRLKEKKEKALKRFQAKQEHFLKALKRIAKTDYPLNPGITRDQFLDHFKEIALSLKAKLENENPLTDLHEARKESKRLMYNVAFLNSTEVEWLDSYLKTAKLDALQIDLGEWHDKVLFLDLLKKQPQTPQTAEVMTHLEQEIEQTHTAILNDAKEL